MLDTVPSCNLVQHKGNMMQPRENGKNPNFGSPKFFSWVSPLLVVRQCPKLSSYATLRKTNGANLKNNKKPNFGLDFGPFDPNVPPPSQLFLRVLLQLVIINCSKLSSFAI